MKIKIVPKKVDYKVSKWLSQTMLLNIDEMAAFFEVLGEFSLLKTGTVEENLGFHSKEDFLNLFEHYIFSLKTEESIKFPSFLMCFNEDDVYSIQTSSGKFLNYPRKPLIHIREHKFQITSDMRIQTMVFGKESIRFGFTFTYPQIFFDPETKKIVETLKDKENLNTDAFYKIQRFVRDFTRPLPLIIEGTKKNATFRIGKKFENDFPFHDLKTKNLGIEWK